MKLIVGMFFEYDGDNKEIEKEMFIYSTEESIMLETNSNVFIDDIVK